MNRSLPQFLVALGSKFKTFKNLSALVVILLLFSGKVNAQFSVTTNSGSGLAPTYTSLANAITALNAATISSPVVITCPTGTETAPSAGYSITKSGTSVNTITIQGNGAANSIITASAAQVSGTKSDAIFKIVGGDYITIQGFKMQENALNTTTALATNNMTEFGVGIFLGTAIDGAQNNTIKNNTISLGSTYQNAIGIFSTSSSSSTNGALAASATSGTNSSNKFYSNIISNVAYGMYFICPGATTTITETGIDIGGSSNATANTITFGNATLSDIAFTSFGGTLPAGIYFRNGVGNNVRFNTVNSNSLSYAQTNGLGGIVYVNTVPVGVTYTSTISDNTITLTNTGTTAITGIDFGYGINTGTIIGNNNTITLNQTSTAANTTQVAGISANYVSATNTLSFNTIVINETETTGAYSGGTRGINLSAAGTTLTANSNNITINQNSSGTGSYTGTIYGIDYTAAATTINSFSNTILVNQTTSVASGIGTAISGIKATTGATTINIGASGTGNTITFKQAVTGSGTYGAGIGYYVNLTAAAHGTINANYNTFNTTGSSFRAPSSLYGISTSSGAIVTLKNINYNTMLIDKPSTLNHFYGITDGSTSPSTPQKAITNNSITVTGLAGTGNAVGIYEIGGPSAPTLTSNFDNNTINFSGANTGQSIGLILGYTKGTANNNTITINNSSTDVSGIWANQTGASAFTITGNTISLTSNSTSPTQMLGISAGATGPFQIYSNTFTALNFTGIITGAPLVSAISVSAGTGNNIYNNTITNISVGAATSTATPTIDGISISGGVSTNVYKNKIYGISTLTTGATGVVDGIKISGGGTASPFNAVYNNLIGGLTASAASNPDAIRGINITSSTASTTNNVYNNTVYLSGSGGTNFGSSGIYHTASATATTAALDLRNNIIYNNITPSGTGSAVAFRRSAGAASNLANYAGTSNNNLFYAGTPGAANLIYSDGTSSAQTMSAYKGGVFTAGTIATRDNLSVSAAISFQSTVGSSANFLKYDTTASTVVESGGANISGLTDDYNGTIRFGNASYVACSPTAGTAPDIGAWELCGVPLPACTAPSAQPTALVLTPATTTATVSFNAASGTPDGYLVIRTTSSTAPTSPSNGSNYSGTALGGTVISTSSSVSISDSGLTASTPYWYWVFPYNGGSTCAGPVYYTGGTILTSTTTTCGLAPVANAATSLGYTSFSANWGTSLGATTYLLDVATDSGFTSMVSGYNGLDVGNVQTYSVIGLSAGNTYYYRVRASNGSCTSSNSATITATTTAITSLVTGNWNATSTWSSGTIPTCGDIITIAATHNVTVNSATNVSKNLTIASGGTLTVASGDLTVGCTLNNTPLTNNGTLTVSGGSLNVNGNITSALGSTFNQSGGNINIDGNNGGSTTGSVASGISILQFNQLNTGINLNGGTITIVDPHANATATLAIGYNNSTVGSQTTTANHTIRLGDGVSTDAGGNVVGFRIDPWTGSAYLSFGNIIINGGSGTNRFVTIAQSLTALGEVTVTTGSTLNLNSTPSLIAAGNVTVNSGGSFINTSGIISGLVASNTGTVLTFGPSTFAQTIGGSGTYQNLATSPTANITSLTVNNTNATGVTISTPLSISGTLTMTAGKINTTSTNLLTLGTSTLAGTLAYTAGQIAGPFARTFPASRTATGTYTVATLYPVGDGTTYLPIHIDPTTSAGGAIVLRGQAFNVNSGTGGAGVASTLSSNRWEALATSGSTNLTNCFVGLNDATIASGRIIAQSASASGTYNAIGPVSTFATGTPNTLKTATAIASASYSGYFTHAAPGPAITSFTPASACPNAATTITVTGTNLGSATSVTLNGEACTIVTNTATQLVITTDATPQAGNIVVTTAANSATSPTALALFTLPTVTASSNAVSNTICSGTNVTLNGGGATSYTWNNSVTNNTAFSPSASTTYTVTGTDGNGCTNTASIAITVNNAVAISSQPSNQVVLPNDNAQFSVTASGTGLTYQWQESTDNGGTWNNVSNGGIYSDATTSLLTLTSVSSENGYQYRCVISGTAPCGSLTSTAATLTISSTAIATHPQNQSICSDSGTASFSITTTGTTPSYQWQVSTNSGSTWSDVSGETTPTLSLSGLTTANNGELYRCALNSGTALSNSALLTVSPISVAGTVSADQGICASTSPANITLTGNTGTIQWQVSSDNSTFTTISGATAATLTSAQMSTLSATRYYRAIVTSGACASSTSGVVTVTVTPTPNAGTVSGTQNACMNGTTTFATNGNSGGTWSSSNTGVASVNTSSGVVSSVSVGTATITYTITGTGGCSTVSATRGVTVNALPNITSATATPSPVCSGENISLIGLNASSSTFNTGRTTPIGTSTYNDGTTGLVFEATSAFTLNSVNVYNNGNAGTLVIKLLNSSGTVLQTSSSFSVPAATGTTVFTATLGWDIPIGTGYRLVATTVTGISLVRESSIGGFPYALGSVGNITNGWFGSNSTSYYHFYNWNITAQINQSNLYSWSWNSTPAIASASGSTTETNTGASATTKTYTVTATNATTGCTNTATTSAVTINPAPIAPTATNSTQCGSGTPTCSVTGTGTSGNTFKWYTVSTGGTALVAQTGSTLSSYPISATTSFYVSESNGTCESARTAVTVTVSTPPAITATATLSTVCSGSPTVLSVNSTNSGYTYAWSNSLGSGASVTASPTANTTYTVTATDSSGGTYNGCSTTATVAITTNALPSAVTLTPSSATICTGSTQSIVASGGTINPTYFSEDFNSGLSSWTVTNSGTSPSVSNWIAQTAPLTDAAGSATFLNFSTTNGGKFAYANPDAGGSGTTTNTVLQSPSFNTLGAASATLTFEHVYLKYSSDITATLEISIDNGATWSVLKDYKTLGSQGTTTSNAQVTTNESITLANTYLNQASVKIRFNYVSTWGFFWLIDNIKVSEIQSTTMSWSPTTTLFTDAAATIAYTGNPRTVYAKPTATTTYTATATSAAGCTSSNTVTVTVSPTSVAGSVSADQAICTGSSPSDITLSGYTGTIQWQVSSNNTTFSNISGATAATLTSAQMSALSATRYYRAVVTSGVCTAANSSAVTVTVNPLPTALVLTGSLACAGATGTITSSTSVSGVDYQLYDSSNATVGAAIPGTGAALSWSSVAIANGYYAKATNTSTTCVSANSNAVNVGTVTTKTWTATSGNWSTASNWSCGILPTATDVIVISSGSPVLDTNFTVGASGSLTISGTGTFTIGASSTLTIEGATNFGGKAVTIKSNATGNGAIGQVTGTNLTGATNVTVERYIPAKRSWRAITAPVSTTTSIYANWQEGGTGNGVNGFEIWNPAGGTGITTGGVSSSLLSYSSSANTWSGITNTQAASTMMDGTKNRPFMAFVTGPYAVNHIGSGAEDTTLRATGTLLTGDQSYPTVAGKYAFIGNPYASPLDLTAVFNTAANATSYAGNVWVWDANVLGTNNVGTYNLFDFAATNYTNLTNNGNITGAQIQSGQAFFVKSAADATFTIKETHKGSVFTNAVFRTAAPELLRVGLYKQVNNEWAGRDGAMTVILADANANQLPNKMANGTENIVFTKNGGNFASNHHLPLVATDVLNVKVWNTTAGANYKLKINTEQFTTTNLDATLEDLFTNARTPLALNGTAVEYPFTVTTDALSTGDRFRIVFQTAALSTNNPKANGFSIVPNPVTGDAFQVNLGTLATGTYTYSICNAIGQEVEKGSINNAAQNTNYTVKFRESAATGMYIMKIKGSDNSVFTAKIIKK